MKKDENRLICLLDKFCSENAQLSLEELRQLYFLLSSKEEEERISQWMQQRWEENLGEFEEVNYDRIFNRVKEQLEASSNKRVKFIRFFQRCAAVLLFPLLGLSGYLAVKTIIDGRPVRKEIVVHVPAEQEYITPSGMRSKIILSDSTVVWINAASRLTVAKGFGESQRNVSLVGEAYFEVRENKQRPFIVTASGLDIKVLGTSFNLSAYPYEAPKAVLIQGSIEATIKDEDNRPLDKLYLVPDQMIKYQDKTVNIESNVNTELYTSWTNGRLVLHKTSMEEVVRTLERWYNVSINLNDDLLKTYHFTGTFDNRSLEQVMSYLSLSSAISYEVDWENDIVNIYSKKKI